MTLDGWIEQYLDHLRFERALSQNTVGAYATDLAKFAAFLESEGCSDLRSIDLGRISAWLRSLSKSGLGPRSAARHLSSVRGFLRFLLREGEILEDPASLAARPKIGRRLPRTLSESEMQRLIGAPDVSTVRGLRDRAMLTLAYSAGLRVSELVTLRLGDVDRQKGVIAAYGKGSKRRLVPIGVIALDHVDAYLKALSTASSARRRRRAESPYLFSTPRGRPLTRQAFWKAVRRYSRAAGLKMPAYPHQLRHAFASHLLAGGADLRSVQILLGHADIITTEVYTHVTRDHVWEAHRRSHPRG